MLNHFRRASIVGAVAGAIALLPGAAQAKSQHHGLQCGKGHAKHSHAVGHGCAKGGHGRHVGHLRTAAGTSTTDQTSTAGQAGTSSSTSPAQQCRTEQAADPAAFAQKHGTNGNGRNAFGKCVSGKSRAQDEQQGATDDQSGEDQADDQAGDDANEANGQDPAERPDNAQAADDSQKD